jgi:hypothetical protein
VKKYCVLTLVFVCSWFAVAQAQVSEADSRKGGTFVGEHSRSNSDRKLYNNLSYSRNSYIGRQETVDPNRHMERSSNQGGKSDSTSGTGPVYNPYIIHWR